MYGRGEKNAELPAITGCSFKPLAKKASDDAKMTIFASSEAFFTE